MLGESRFLDYDRAKQKNFMHIEQAAKNAGVYLDAAIAAYDLKKQAEQQAANIRQNASMEPDQQQATLLAIRQETEQTLQQRLGDHGWANYNRRGKTQWLKKMGGDK